MIPFPWSSRSIFFLVALLCTGLLGFALVLEYFVNLVPCPLCIVQRFFYALILIIALLAYSGWFQSVNTRVYGGIIFALSVLGGAVALRQVWLQHFIPLDTDPTRCGVFFGSFIQSVLLALGGLGNCAIVDWTFLSLSIADWSFLCFLLLSFAGLFLVLWKSPMKGVLVD